MISFLNYRRHPDTRDLMVFYYASKVVFDDICTSLKAKGLLFDTEIEEGAAPVYYVIVPKSKFEEAQIVNNEVLGRHKPMFLSDTYLRYFLITLFLVALAIALTGYIKTNYV